MVGMLELDSEINAISDNKQDMALIWTSCFAFLLFGQIIDNTRKIKILFVALELTSAFWFIVMGYATYLNS